MSQHNIKKTTLTLDVTIFRMNKPFQKLTLLVVAVLFISTATARKIPGRLVDLKGHVVDVTFKIPFKFLSSEPNYERIQYRVVYYDATGTKAVLRPGDAREITFNHKNEEIRMLSRADSSR